MSRSKKPVKDVAVADQLRAARAIIAKPEAWAKDWLAYDAEGRWVDPLDPRACRFCAAGAIQRATNGHRVGIPGVYLDKATGGSFVVFNDREGTTHGDILAAFDRAIRAAEAGEF